MDHIEAQWRAKAAGERGEGAAIRSEKRYHPREGARSAERCFPCRPHQAEGVEGRLKGHGVDVGQRGEEAVDLCFREVVRNIDHQAAVSVRATLPLERRFKNAAAEAAAIVGFKLLSLLH